MFIIIMQHAPKTFRNGGGCYGLEELGKILWQRKRNCTMRLPVYFREAENDPAQWGKKYILAATGVREAV